MSVPTVSFAERDIFFFEVSRQVMSPTQGNVSYARSVLLFVNFESTGSRDPMAYVVHQRAYTGAHVFHDLIPMSSMSHWFPSQDSSMSSVLFGAVMIVSRSVIQACTELSRVLLLT